MTGRRAIILAFLLICAAPAAGAAADRKSAEDALRAALDFVLPLNNQGGYFAGFSPDGQRFWGEWNPVGRDVVTIQPPGTCTVGDVFLDAYLALDDDKYLTAAEAAAGFIIRAQQPNGGWFYECWVTDRGLIPCHQNTPAGPPSTTKNAGVLEDDCMRGQMEFLVKLHQVTGEKKYLDSARKGADFLVTAQYPDGGWPQSYPPPESGYSRYSTLNDGVFEDSIHLLLDFHRRTEDARYLEAAEKAGNWLISNQLPEPTPGWAQQYDPDGQPAWARDWEPPAACATATSGALTALLELYLETGRDEFRGPFPAATAWLERSEIMPGEWARYYDPQTGRPIYARGYRISYSPDIIDWGLYPSFQGEFGCVSAIREWEEFSDLGRERCLELKKRENPADSESRSMDGSTARAARAIESRDPCGGWVTGGWVMTGEWARNCRVLIDYLAVND